MRPRGAKRLFRFTSRTSGEIHRDIDDEVTFHLEMRVEALRRRAWVRPMPVRRHRASSGTTSPTTPLAADRRDRRAAQPLAANRRRVPAGHAGRPPPAAAQSGVRPAPSARSAWASAPTPPSTACSTRCCCGRCRCPSRIAWRCLGDTPRRRHQQRVRRRIPRLARAPDTVRCPRADDPRASQPARPRRHRAADRHGGIHEFLQVLGVPAVLGRGFLPDEDRPADRQDVVMITEDFWRRRFGGDRGILGQRLVLDDVPRTVIGVLPRARCSFRRTRLRARGARTRDVTRRAPAVAAVFGRSAAGHVRRRGRRTQGDQEAARQRLSRLFKQ